MLDIVGIVIVFCIILFSMMLHELAHGLTAYWLGDETAKLDGRLSLNPLKHIDPVMSVLVPMMLYLMGAPVLGGAKPVPVNKNNLRYGEWGMALVALAGPMTNLLLAFASFLVGYFTGALYVGGIGGSICYELVIINLGFMIFNLIPIAPLDGSRIVYAFAPDGIRRLMDILERYGLIIVYVMVAIFGSVLSAFINNMMLGILDGFYFIVGV